MEDTKKAFTEHLSELRKALVGAVVTLAVCFIVIFLLFGEELMSFILAPLKSFGIEAVYTAVGEVWLTEMKVALIAAFVVAFPGISFFFWRFLRPALYHNERKTFVLFYCISVLLFLVGVCFAYFMVLALTLGFFFSFGAGTAEPMLTISKYVSFITSFIIPFGLIFLLPMFVLLLTKAGILKYEVLAKSRKYVIVILTVLAAIITPPDIVSQIMILVPMVVLWEISLIIAKGIERKKQKESIIITETE